MRILARDRRAGRTARGTRFRTGPWVPAAPRWIAVLVLAGLAGFPGIGRAATPSMSAHATGARDTVAAVPSPGPAGAGEVAEAPEAGPVPHAPTDPAAVPEGSFVRVTLDGGVSPFTVVSWDVTVRGSTAVVTLVKENLCQSGQRERVRLLEGDNARSLLAALKEAGAWNCPVPPVAQAGRAADHAAPADQPRYEVWTAWGRNMVRYHLGQKALRDAPCALHLVTAVTAEVRRRLDTLPMRDLYYPAEKMGWVTMTASEPASATFDGWDTVQLPVYALEVVEGEHEVVVTGESGRTRHFLVKVVPGMTQPVHVVLEDPVNGAPPPVPK